MACGRSYVPCIGGGILGPMAKSRRITFESTARLYYRSPLLRLIEGTVLLLGVFEDESKESNFHQEHCDLLEAQFESLQDIGLALEPVRANLHGSRFGESKDDSLAVIGQFIDYALALGLSVGRALQDQDSALAKSWTNDPVIDAWLDRIEALSKEWRDEDDPAWQQARRVEASLFAKAGTESDISAGQQQAQISMVAGVEYVRHAAQLCWKHGLRSALSPVILVVLDLALVAEKLGSVEDGEVTADGVLGPVLPAGILAPFKSEGDVPPKTIEHLHPEYELLSMDNRKIHRRFGSAHSKTVKSIFESWGYERGWSWKKADFESLFDRLALGKTVSASARRHKPQPDRKTLQKRHSRFLKAMRLDLPERPARGKSVH